MFDRYDSHDSTTIQNIRSGPDGAQVLVIAGVIGASVIGLGMALAAIAAMIWAVVTAVLGLGVIWGAVQIYGAKKQAEMAAHYRAVEFAARAAAGVSADAPYILDATPARALPPGQVSVNGRPRAESASVARRR